MIVVASALTPNTLIVPLSKPLQLTLVDEASTVTSISSLISTVAVATQTPSLFPLAALAVIT